MTSAPQTPSPLVGLAPAYAKKPRSPRRPKHKFNLKFKPYHVQPFMLAPVLPGETLKSLMMQSQTWSDPLEAVTMKNIGWWLENFFFYVRHTDLTDYEVAESGLGYDLVSMFTSGASMASYEEASAVTWSYCPPDGIDFTAAAVDRIVDCYFREDGDQSSTSQDSDIPLAAIHVQGNSDWAKHLTIDTSYAANDSREAVPTYVSELEASFQEWAAQVDAGLMTMTYEDWMKSYGGKSPVQSVDRPEHHKPELLGYDRQFTYPTNTVDQTDGVPVSSVGWRVQHRLNKAYRFDAPGFIVGITVARPKVYYGRQEGSIASMMKTRESWLPAVLADDLDYSHLEITTATGPLKTVSGATGFNEDYWIDLKDLLNHGDQFINYAPDKDAAPFLNLPYAYARYPATSGTPNDLNKWFETTDGTQYMRSDGVCSLNILGRTKETYSAPYLRERS